MSFKDAVINQEARTQNNMKAYASTTNACVDLFYKIGASRGQDIIPQFVAAKIENSDLAGRIALWARDIRGGAGERQLFRDILAYLEKYEPDMFFRFVSKVPELGRWDDLLINFTSYNAREYVYSFIKKAIEEGNGLAAKWMPRKGVKAVELRRAWGMTPKQYRKFLVNNTCVVEQLMCAKEWDKINFSHVPSLAASRYKAAFYRNAEARFTQYVEDLIAGKEGVKVNAGAVYPYDILKGIDLSYMNKSKAEIDHAIEQWKALPNYLGDAKVLPMCDTSGSMFVSVGSVHAIDICISLGLYCAEKNTGVFKDLILTFSESPCLEHVKGNVVQKALQLSTAAWGMNTDLHKAFDLVLRTAVNGKVKPEDMPATLLIFSDMQFDCCVRFDDSAIEMIRRKYNNAGYEMPQVVFWNLNAYSNVPVKYNEQGVALVSGFSPSILKAILSNKLERFTPETVMLEAVMSDRYNF